jgi:hypothetical protein
MTAMLQPTMKFQWLQIHMGDTAPHPSALRMGDSVYAQVLQQKWEHPNGEDDDGWSHPGEWRDI